MRQIAGVLIVWGLIVSAASSAAPMAGQAPVTSEPAFEVVSIKRNLSPNPVGSGLSAPQPGGRYIAMGVTARRLIGDAYDAEQIIGGPSWLDVDRFDVNARADGNPAPAEIRRLIGPMLADRFALAFHLEAREMPVYALTVARSDRALGSHLRQSDPTCAAEARRYFPGATGFPPPCGDFRMGARALTARGMTMAGLGGLLRGRVGRPVLDRTELEGAFDLELEWTTDGGLVPFLPGPPDTGGASDVVAVDGISLFTALQDQLGLRLDATRGPVEVLVIDRIEPPTPD
jgi:uncharacterized protein (TIGR03435 family)